ncbi:MULTISPECIES: RIP metalloprotease RseP [unclassified Leptolyngbya]|uniref:RIP metalloprotease RseP n=1 Tax=unclassified Leptolyngbya TaxID=2650499 RepID=UPI0016862C06|nr:MULTISPECIES: RIP metalloprotease RseP [unclassified Leptolyngbya]MBD1910158.1 RIP metalloprotease RseP [Leptolyngbya sp. FACHB-8]MBD2153590.1 RIP metalloprotease RseP [Leptolyngbya sp. FACHB-16]
MSVFAAIAVLALLIVVHELGHFLAARLQGIHVNRFSIGFGPILWKYQGPETEYAIRAFPLGGFVGFPDEDPDSTIPDNDPNLLKNRPVIDRAIVISAGVIANLLFAYLVFATQVGVVGVQQPHFEPGVLISRVTSTDVPAAQAGLKDGDLILAVDDLVLGEGQEANSQFREIILDSPNKSLSLRVQRDDRQFDLQVTPRSNDKGDGIIGTELRPNGSIDFRRPHSLFEVLSESARQFQIAVIMTARGFFTLITNFAAVADQVAGPVKIVEQGAAMAANNLASLFPFTAIISINLAIINILPLPALDGGQLAFLLIEAVRGKPLPSRFQENVMQTGLVLLLGLGIFLIVRDTTQLGVVQKLFQ